MAVCPGLSPAAALRGRGVGIESFHSSRAWNFPLVAFACCHTVCESDEPGSPVRICGSDDDFAFKGAGQPLDIVELTCSSLVPGAAANRRENTRFINSVVDRLLK
jgi:hypothetical protein